MKLLTR